MARLLIPSELRRPLSIQFIELSLPHPSLLSLRPSSFSSHLSRLYTSLCPRVGIQRPHNRLLSLILLLSSLARFLSLSPFFSRIHSRRLFSFHHRIFHRHRNAVLPIPRKRNETEEERRCKRRRREARERVRCSGGSGDGGGGG